MGKGLLSVAVYCCICIASMYLIKKQYYCNMILNSDASHGNKKISTIAITSIGLLFACYNLFITEISVPPKGDRFYYMRYFYEGYDTTPGLEAVMKIVHLFSDDIRTLYFVTTLFAIVCLLAAYNISKEALPCSIFFIMTTVYIFCTFSVIKQSYANAIIILAISYTLRNEKHDTLKAIILTFLATTFHPTAIIGIPIIVAIKLKKTNVRILVFFVAMLIIVFFLEDTMRLTASVLMPIAPGVSMKIMQYFSQINGGIDSISVVIMGLPYYVVTLWGWLNRKHYKKVIPNFDNYLMISAMTSFVYVISIYEEWLYRLSYYLYFTTGILFIKMLQESKLKGNKVLLSIAVIGANITMTVRFLILMFVNQGGF